MDSKIFFLVENKEFNKMLQECLGCFDRHSGLVIEVIMMIDHDPEKLPASSMVVLFVTNTLSQSQNYIEWVKKAKILKHTLIGLLIEEISNNEKIKDDFAHLFEIYKARFNPTGFDCFLWISDHFENFTNLIEMYTQRRVGRLSFKF